MVDKVSLRLNFQSIHFRQNRPCHPPARMTQDDRPLKPLKSLLPTRSPSLGWCTSPETRHPSLQAVSSIPLELVSTKPSNALSNDSSAPSSTDQLDHNQKLRSSRSICRCPSMAFQCEHLILNLRQSVSDGGISRRRPFKITH
jgi:hypothetical protein